MKKILKTIQCCAKWDDEEQRRRINLTGASKRQVDECKKRMLSVKQALLRNQAFHLLRHSISCARKQCFPGAQGGDTRGTDCKRAAKP